MISLLGLIAAAGAAEISDVWVYAPGRRTLGLDGVSFVEGERDGWRQMHATEAGLEALSAAGLPWVPASPTRPDTAGYRSPEEMVVALEALAAAHPDLVRLVDVGRSLEDRPIIGVTLTASQAPESHWRILGAHHGDELPTGELALALAQALVDDYGETPDVTDLLDSSTVIIVPHVNPDGLARVSRYSASGVDLNRNYAHEWRAESFGSGEAAFSEPETRAIRTLSQWNPFHAGLSLHAGTTNIGWVWNHTTESAPDSDLMEAIAARYAEQTGDPDFWITCGADWYLTNGDTTDWTYGRLGTLDFTVEVSQDKTPPAADLPGLIAQHVPAMLDFLTAPLQIRGQLTDAVTGRGIPGSVTLDGQPLLTGPQGRFSRLVSDADPWDLTAQAPGYQAQTISLSAGESTHIALTPQALSQARPVPALIGGAHAHFLLSGDQVTLTLPGEDPVQPERHGIAWTLDASSLAPGPWSIQVDGQIIPRGLLITASDASAALTAVTQTDGLLQLDGTGLGRGSQAYAVVGPERALLPLDPSSETSERIVLNIQQLPGDETIDVLLVTAGSVLSIHDALGTPLFTAPSADPQTGEAPAATCASTTLPAAWAMIVLPLGLLARRQT